MKTNNDTSRRDLSAAASRGSSEVDATLTQKVTKSASLVAGLLIAGIYFGCLLRLAGVV